MLCITCLPLPILSNRIHLHNGVLNMARMILVIANLSVAFQLTMLVVTGTLLTILTTRNYLSLLLLILSTQPESHWVLLASLWIFHSPGIFSFYSMLCSTRSVWYCVMLAFFLNFSSPRHHLFVLHGQCHFLHPAGIWAENSYFIPSTRTWTEALTLPFPATSKSQVVSSL